MQGGIEFEYLKINNGKRVGTLYSTFYSDFSEVIINNLHPYMLITHYPLPQKMLNHRYSFLGQFNGKCSCVYSLKLPPKLPKTYP